MNYFEYVGLSCVEVARVWGLLILQMERIEEKNGHYIHCNTRQTRNLRNRRVLLGSCGILNRCKILYENSEDYRSEGKTAHFRNSENANVWVQNWQHGYLFPTHPLSSVMCRASQSSVGGELTDLGMVVLESRRRFDQNHVDSRSIMFLHDKAVMIGWIFGDRASGLQVEAGMNVWKVLKRYVSRDIAHCCYTTEGGYYRNNGVVHLRD